MAELEYKDMSNNTPEALRLADELDGCAYSIPADKRGWTDDGRPQNTCTDAAAELRRLHDENEKLRATLADQPAEQKPVNIGPEWVPCVKLPVTVHVRHQRPGETHVSTREGITPVKPDDLIMRGMAGEEYPIGREIFERTYRLGEAPQPAKREPLTWDELDVLWEKQRSKPFKSHGEDLMEFARAVERAHGITKEGT